MGLLGKKIEREGVCARVGITSVIAGPPSAKKSIIVPNTCGLICCETGHERKAVQIIEVTSHETSSLLVTDIKSCPKKTRVQPSTSKSFLASGDFRRSLLPG